MIIGPIFGREASITPRRERHFVFRTVYVAAWLVLVITSWLVLKGTQDVRNAGDLARFGSLLFHVLVPLQLALVTFLSALKCVSVVAQEKDRRTLILLLMTRLSNNELVLGKLFAGLLDVFVALLAALPLFALITLLGGVSLGQVARVYAVTVTTAIAAGSVGTMFAFWREKTFQTLAITALSLVIWAGAWEAVHAGVLGERMAGIPATAWADAFSPVRAIAAASLPELVAPREFGPLGSATHAFLLIALTASLLMNAWTMARVRIWNPSREARPILNEEEHKASIWGVEHDLAQERSGMSHAALTGDAKAAAVRREAEVARAGHIDARGQNTSARSRSSRPVWDHPILWREVCTWAYGRKVLLIKFAFLLFFAMAALGLHAAVASGATTQRSVGRVVPPAANSLAPLFLISLVIMNALAVNSITNERDGNALDLLLVTDITPSEFVFGKLAGVLWLCREMIVLPIALCGYLWWTGGLTGENLIYTIGGLLVMNVFVTTLGIHCGMVYANSRSAIGISLGIVFFLFLGVVTCLLMMLSFSGSFQTQLAPFLLFVMGGGIGLFVALGIRNPSPAILAASVTLPLATFFAITSFLLRNRELTVFLVSAAAYGFTTAAMLVPAIYEFDFAMGRTKGAEE